MDDEESRPVRRADGAGAGTEYAGEPVPRVAGGASARREAGPCQHRDGVRFVRAGRRPGAGDPVCPVRAGQLICRECVGAAVFHAGRTVRHAGDDRTEALPEAEHLRRFHRRRRRPQYRPDGGSHYYAGQYHGAGLSAVFAGGVPPHRYADRLCGGAAVSYLIINLVLESGVKESI